jgi:hypothetical protein
MTAISHRLVGYDPASERVAIEDKIPDSRLDYAKRVAEVGADDPEAVLCYKLTGAQIRDIAGAIGIVIDAETLNFYMEGFAEPDRLDPPE